MLTRPKIPWIRASSARASSLPRPSSFTPEASSQPCASAMAARMPVYEPGPRPMAMRSICSRSTPALRKACSIMPSGPRPPVSTTSKQVVPLGIALRTATLRWEDENSRARRFIGDAARGGIEFLEFYPDHIGGSSILRIAYGVFRIFGKPAVNPFDDGDAGGLQVFFEAGGDEYLQ